MTVRRRAKVIFRGQLIPLKNYLLQMGDPYFVSMFMNGLML